MNSIILFDVDGTVTNYERIDNLAVSKCFGNSKIVVGLDKLLWKINRWDIIPNNFQLFKLRIWMYSVLSLSNYDSKLKEYESIYVSETKKAVNNCYNGIYEKLKHLKIEMRLLSNNQLDTSANPYIISVKNKKKYVMEHICGKYTNIYVVGNNWSDDIKFGLKLKSKNLNACPVYIGESKLLIKWLFRKKAVLVYSTLEEFISFVTGKKE